MRSTVEGVETVEHMEFLKREGCDELQGFLISQPIPASAVRKQCVGEKLPVKSEYQRLAG